MYSILMQSLWVERTTLTLVQSLPGISRWFEVDKRELVSASVEYEIVSHVTQATLILSFILQVAI